VAADVSSAACAGGMLPDDVSNSILAAPGYDIFPGVEFSQHYNYNCPNDTCLYKRQSTQVSSRTPSLAA